ncbi:MULTISPECIES: RNA polymerase sigma-70 factor [unclassified Sphingobacterium]|uniref:RNA polymerase sigma-70 factor n=1 Tax=unclassified Sphingobacterium TaxID=2609468 RepID=UPI00104ECA59|nr:MULTISPECIES: RNA polymerase sigma-70 factor [unclassified Sphingobacterium]MCS3556806.1 RNA polymerase sigma-70 factor (ECF subfamily) [Sphingobacterium sp. JUb21]QQD11642.1 RNA polymerase sigma-70 factor [Sphingobacterium sp. UDSM-2020]TCQ99268.1 RNA polymerase sigma-70 factor (ECF subfamily) [Sphingobacterium sp. JUb20]
MEFESLNDDQLIARLQMSDARAITEIYRRYWKKLLAIAYNHIRDKDDAEEVVQTVFIKLWDKRNDIAIGQLPNYLATAVKYSVFSMIQKKNRKDEVGQFFVMNHQSQDYEEEKIYTIFLRQYIKGVVEELPDRCRLVFTYSREQGKTIPEIATTMNIAEKTVEAHLTKALRRIKHSLKAIGISVAIAISFYIFW